MPNPVTLQHGVTIVFCSAVAVQLFYYLYFYLAIALKKPAGQAVPGSTSPISVVICARNEAENLAKYLPFILNQDYPDFEVIVVNDCSEDETEIVLNQMKKRSSRLKVSKIVKDEKFTHGKKLALTIGIKAASNEWLVLTDADCYPESDQWLRLMAEQFTSDKAIVLGYGGFIKQKGLLNNLIRFDAAFIAMQFLGFALRGNPYMGVGRNLAYRKSMFIAHKGFSKHHHIVSGDDDLLVNELANRKNTAVEIRKDAHTRTAAKTTFLAWSRQKRRHLTTGFRYKFTHRFLLGSEVFSRLALYGLFIWMLVTGLNTTLALVVFGLRLLFQGIVLNLAWKRLNEKYLLLPSLFYDIIIPFIYAGMMLSNLVNGKNAQWRSAQIYRKKRSMTIN